MSDATPASIVLTSPRLILSLCGAEHAQAVLEYRLRNREHLRINSPTVGARYWTLEYWRERLAEHLGEAHAERSFRFYLFLRKDSSRVVGDCGLTNIIRGAFHAAHMGYNLDEQCVGKGLMTEALQALIAFGFGTQKLHRIMANHRPENLRSAKLLRRLGFVVEGYARDYLLLDGEWRDHVLTSLTNPAYQVE